MAQVDVLTLVREQTRPQHERLERLMPFGSEALSLDSYRKLLMKFLGVFDPIENMIRQIELPAELELSKRARSRLLVNDLRSLGFNDAIIERVPRCADIPSTSSMAKALGAMYVLEGSTLGGQFISRMVNERLGLTEQSGCAFFNSYGSEVSLMWKRFCEIVRRQVVGQTAEHEFILSARSTFATFESWVERSNAHHA